METEKLTREIDNNTFTLEKKEEKENLLLKKNSFIMQRKEWFSRKMFGFTPDDILSLSQEYRTKERKVSIAYLLYKLFISSYLVIAYVLSHLQFAWKHDEYKCDEVNDMNNAMSESNDTKQLEKLEEKNHLCSLSSIWPYYWLYLTMWSFNFYTICIFLDTGLVFYRYLKENKNKGERRKLEEGSSEADSLKLLHPRFIVLSKISWLLATLSYPIAFTITVIYWGFLYKGAATALKFYMEFNVHAVQSIIAFTDILVSARPWRVQHFYVPLIYGIVYGLFQVIYIVGIGGKDEKGHDYIYRILKWKSEPGKAVAFTLAICLMGLIFYLLICLLAYGRDRYWRKWKNNH